MSKIKDILEKMKTQWVPYHALRLIVAKRVWLLIACLYFLSQLFTVWGFYFASMSMTTMSALTFHLYSVLVIATGWMVYELGEYILSISVPSRRWMIGIPILFASIFVILALISHLQLI